MKKFLKLFFVLICLSTFAQTNFSNPLFLNGTQNTFDRNFRVLGLDQNNEVKSMYLGTALIDTSTASWCDLILYPNNYAFKAKYRLKGDFAEIEIINLVPGVLLPTEKLINLPAGLSGNE